jgi:hypothetical protein
MGYYDQYPPNPASLRGEGNLAAEWAKRLPAIGTTVTETPHNWQYDIVLGLRTRNTQRGAHGHFRYAIVKYHDGKGRHYELLTETGGKVAKAC